MTSYSMANYGSASSSAFLALCNSTICLSPSNATLICGRLREGKEKKRKRSSVREEKGREGEKAEKDRIITRFSSQISDFGFQIAQGEVKHP
jgi:hypothetical protein